MGWGGWWRLQLLSFGAQVDTTSLQIQTQTLPTDPGFSCPLTVEALDEQNEPWPCNSQWMSDYEGQDWYNNTLYSVYPLRCACLSFELLSYQFCASLRFAHPSFPVVEFLPCLRHVELQRCSVWNLVSIDPCKVGPKNEWTKVFPNS